MQMVGCSFSFVTSFGASLRNSLSFRPKFSNYPNSQPPFPCFLEECWPFFIQVRRWSLMSSTWTFHSNFSIFLLFHWKAQWFYQWFPWRHHWFDWLNDDLAQAVLWRQSSKEICKVGNMFYLDWFWSRRDCVCCYLLRSFGGRKEGNEKNNIRLRFSTFDLSRINS